MNFHKAIWSIQCGRMKAINILSSVLGSQKSEIQRVKKKEYIILELHLWTEIKFDQFHQSNFFLKEYQCEIWRGGQHLALQKGIRVFRVFSAKICST